MSKIIITEVDKSEIVPSSAGIYKIATTSTTGPLNKLEIIGSLIPRIRWWQFWRYHLIKKRYQEEKKAVETFHKIFGKPKESI